MRVERSQRGPASVKRKRQFQFFSLDAAMHFASSSLSFFHPPNSSGDRALSSSLTDMLPRGDWSVHVHLRDRQGHGAGRVQVVGEQGVAPRERVGHRRSCRCS